MTAVKLKHIFTQFICPKHVEHIILHLGRRHVNAATATA